MITERCCRWGEKYCFLFVVVVVFGVSVLVKPLCTLLLCCSMEDDLYEGQFSPLSSANKSQSKRDVSRKTLVLWYKLFCFYFEGFVQTVEVFAAPWWSNTVRAHFSPFWCLRGCLPPVCLQQSSDQQTPKRQQTRTRSGIQLLATSWLVDAFLL